MGNIVREKAAGFFAQGSIMTLRVAQLLPQGVFSDIFFIHAYVKHI